VASAHSSSWGSGSRSLRLGLMTSTWRVGGWYVVGATDPAWFFGAFSFGFRFGSLRGRSRPFAIARTSDA
jgi:hypothetical protein